MSTESDQAKEIYYLLGGDPTIWLEQAKRLKLSAELIWSHFEPIMRKSATLQDVREKQLAYMNSYMLLLGLAFENLIKGIFVARKQVSIVNGKLDASAWNVRGGHGFSTYARDVTALSDRESDLLTRLEEHVYWAGRYVIPTKEQVYVAATTPANLKKVLSTDPSVADHLFERLTVILMQDWEVHQSHL